MDFTKAIKEMNKGKILSYHEDNELVYRIEDNELQCKLRDATVWCKSQNTLYDHAQQEWFESDTDKDWKLSDNTIFDGATITNIKKCRDLILEDLMALGLIHYAGTTTKVINKRFGDL